MSTILRHRIALASKPAVCAPPLIGIAVHPRAGASGYNHLDLAHIVSTLVPDLAYLDSQIGGLAVHGGNLSVANFFHAAVRSPGVRKLEAFLPPALMANRDGLKAAASHLLPPEMMGQGRLSFYPFHALPDVFADGEPRILRVHDPESLARERYLRDAFAVGPTPISCDTHLHGQNPSWGALQRLGAAVPVGYDSIVSLSRAHAEATRRLFDGFLAPAGSELPCRIDVIGRPVDCERFQPVDSRRKLELRKELDWPVAGRIVLYLARVTAHGKAELAPLVRAFAKASQKEDTLIVVGPESSPGIFERLKAVARECGVENQLLLPGQASVRDRWKCYAAADLYVLPGDTIQEGYGVTVMEAMASGLPVIASDWDGFKDQVVDGETGYLIPTYWSPGLERVAALSPVTPQIVDYLLLGQSVIVDRPSLERRLRELLQSEALRTEMGAKGRERALRNSVEQIMGQIVALWDLQAKLAAAEPEHQRQARRKSAAALGLPTPYLSLFSGYGTGVLEEGSALRMTDLGRSVYAGDAKVAMYDETVAITRPDVVAGIVAFAGERPAAHYKFGQIVDSVTGSSGAPRDLVAYSLGLLIKADVFELALS